MTGNTKQVSFLNILKNLKFVRKIQFSFLIIAVISSFIALNDYLQMNEFDDAKNSIFQDYIAPMEKIDELYSQFQKIQFLMLKFSVQFTHNSISKVLN